MRVLRKGTENNLILYLNRKFMNLQSIQRFEQYVIENNYANDNQSFVSNCLNKCRNQDCQDKREEFDHNLSSWIARNSEIETVIGIYLEFRLYNFLSELSPKFIETSSVEVADIVIQTEGLNFEIECTHSLRKTMKQFDEKTTFKSQNVLNEKEGRKQAEAAVGLIDSFYAHWSIRKALARKAYKNIHQPFLIYFWYPTNGFSLSISDFKDFLNHPYQYQVTPDRSKWSKIDGLLQTLEGEIDLGEFKEAEKDIDEPIKNQFYNLITKERIVQEQENYKIQMLVGGNVDLYRKNPPTKNQLKEYIVNSLIFTYMIQKSTTLVGLIVDHSKLDENPRIEMANRNRKRDEFNIIKRKLREKMLLK